MKKFHIFIGLFMFMVFQAGQLKSETSVIDLKLENGGEHRAILYDAKGDKGAILLHQNGKIAQSWSPLAISLQKEGITSIALHVLTSYDVNAAAAKLIEMGKKEIILIGASYGGGIVINTLAEATPKLVSKAIFLATADRGAVRSPDIDKLYIVAKKDIYANAAYSAFDAAAEPKQLIEYEGRAHAQDLFNSEHAVDVEKQILAFIQK